MTTAPAGRCYCQSKDCAASNFDYNAHCYKCGQKMRYVPVLTKPTTSPPAGKAGKGGGKGSGKDKGKSAKQGGQTCLCCGGANHAKAECRSAHKECNICGKVGHLAVVCRAAPAANAGSKPAGKGGKSSGKGATFSDEDFKTRAIREGWAPPAEAAAPAQQAPAEPTAASISVKGKAKEAAQKAFDLAGKKKLAAKTALNNADEHLEKMAEAMVKAEAEFKKELSLACKADSPTTPKAAIDLDLILAAAQDPTKIAGLFVSLGDD